MAASAGRGLRHGQCPGRRCHPARWHHTGRRPARATPPASGPSDGLGLPGYAGAPASGRARTHAAGPASPADRLHEQQLQGFSDVCRFRSGGLAGWAPRFWRSPCGEAAGSILTAVAATPGGAAAAGSGPGPHGRPQVPARASRQLHAPAGIPAGRWPVRPASSADSCKATSLRHAGRQVAGQATSSPDPAKAARHFCNPNAISRQGVKKDPGNPISLVSADLRWQRGPAAHATPGKPRRTSARARRSQH